MKRRNGFTLVEVIVSIVLVSIILVSMLTTLVKLKELYNEIHENSDALVYSSSIARIINNDIIKNNGIRYATCNSEGNLCEIILGNDNRRRIEIDTKTDVVTEPDGRGTLRSLNSVSTLRYVDTTDKNNESMLYLRTLEANIYTSYDANGVMKYTTSDGFNFNRMVLDQYEKDTTDGKKDVVTSIKINIYDGIDETDQNFSAMVYGSGRYDDSGYRGREFRIELDDNGSNLYRGTDAIDEVFGVGYFAADSAHNLDEKIYSINVPKKDGWMFAGYYHNTGTVNPAAIVDSEGNIVASSTHFLGDEIITNGVGRVQAVWELCVGGYEYNRDTGECKQRTYLVGLDKAGGTGGPDSITAKYRVILPTIEVPTRAGYIFNGYFTGTNGSGKKYIETNGTSNGIWLEADWTSDKKLHASWTARNDTPYKVVHWLQKVDAADAENSTNYTATDTENKQGVTDSTVTPPVKSYAGFASPAAKQLVIKGDGTAVLNYYYKRNKYTVTVNAGSGISSVSGGGTYHYGKNITINATPKAGYSWSKWTNASGGQVTTTKSYSFNVNGAVNYTANATANTNTAYTVKHYKQNIAKTGYDLADTDSLTGTTDTAVSPNRKTYTGFTSPDAKTVTINGNGSSLVEYYYTRNSYYLDLNGTLDGTSSGNISGYGTADVYVNGTKVATGVTDHYSMYSYGSSYEIKNIKALEGRSYSGNSSYSGTIGASTTSVTLPFGSKQYTISYDANGGTGAPGSHSYYYSNTATTNLSNVSPSRTGYQYLGWATTSTATAKEYSPGQSWNRNIAHDTKLYAVWKANTYNIEFNANGGSGTTAKVTCTYGSDCTLTTNGFSKTGYSFQGWGNNSSDTTAAYSNGAKVKNLATSGTKTLYAIWKANTYYIDFNANGGSGTTARATCTYDRSCALTANGFSRSGYAFQGWGTSSGATTATYSNRQNVTNLATSGTKTLYAVWKATDVCEAAGKASMQKWTGASSLGTGSSTTLCDSRDGRTYKVTKLSDGKVWMSEDLKLDVLASLSKINSSTTDHPGTLSSSSIQKYTISAYDWYGKSVYRVYGWVPKNNNANVLQYTYYVNSGIYSSKLALANTSGTGSLCPAGWHLPNKNSHEFCNAARKYGRNYIGYDFANATGACRTITNAANPSYTNDFLPFYNNFKNTCNLPNAYSQTTYPNNDYYNPVTTYYGVLYNHDDSACREQWGATSPFGCTTNSEVSYGYANFWQNDGTAYGFTQGYVIPEGGGGGFPTYGVSDSAYGYDGLPLRCVKD